jgi:two-component system OmpR family response regulator
MVTMVKGKRMRVLVVDDEREMREMIYSSLTYYRGFYVETMQDGAHCLAALEKDYYDMLITDVSMPCMNG